MEDTLKIKIGLSVYKGDWEGALWTVTGYPKKEMTVKDFESAYEFEEFIQKKIDCEGINFDSEFCQFFAYADSPERAIKFANDIDAFFEKVREMLD